MIYFIGIGVSILIQWLKNSYGTSGMKTVFILFLVSLAAAVGYTYLSYLGVWESVAKILMTAGAFYSFVIQRFETEK